MCDVAVSLTEAGTTEREAWNDALSPYLSAFLTAEKGKAAALAVRETSPSFFSSLSFWRLPFPSFSVISFLLPSLSPSLSSSVRSSLFHSRHFFRRETSLTYSPSLPPSLPPFLPPSLPPSFQAGEHFFTFCITGIEAEGEEEEEEDELEDVVNTEFSLGTLVDGCTPSLPPLPPSLPASLSLSVRYSNPHTFPPLPPSGYGGKILLHNTRLWLKRGRRYGIVGKNGCGKTTLMRNIANGSLDGLPEGLKVQSSHPCPSLSPSLPPSLRPST